MSRRLTRRVHSGPACTGGFGYSGRSSWIFSHARVRGAYQAAEARPLATVQNM